MSDPATIWLEPECWVDPDTGRLWSEYDVWSGDCDPDAKPTRYVRADLHDELVDALRRLSADAGGVLRFNEPGLRELIGNTNYSVLQKRVDEARAVLAK